MYQASVYDKAKTLQVDLVHYFLEEYFDLIDLRPYGDDKILDVGSGDGGITVDILLKRFGNDDKQSMTGCDKSTEMLNYAQEKYKERANVKFTLMDIETKILPSGMINEYDHIFSFSCLNWVNDLEQAAKNFNEMLKPDGNLFVITSTWNGLYQSYHDISVGKSKWAKYLKDAYLHIPTYYYHEEPDEDFKNLLKKINFNVIRCKHVCMEHLFNSLEQYKVFSDAVNPFKRNMPPNVLDDYYEYFVRHTLKTKFVHQQEDGTIFFKYYVLFVYATK